ncbi:hypothetical protein NE237_032151 [Protea cynaroides]|uniref:Uncharacterized protein n=1 Tax=Protea cynaroides TaxID=273540 RepID=A0A9Q0R347_9MAGN|nr:hypothetical protein NE237_032151 [Protea cynaroides]
MIKIPHLEKLKFASSFKTESRANNRLQISTSSDVLTAYFRPSWLSLKLGDCLLCSLIQISSMLIRLPIIIDYLPKIFSLSSTFLQILIRRQKASLVPLSASAPQQAGPSIVQSRQLRSLTVRPQPTSR